MELTEKNEIIVEKQNKISKLESEIEYYKKTLNLFNSKISTENKNVTFKINSVIGDSNTGKIIVEGILINNGIIRSIQTKRVKAFDPKGNGINKFKMSVGNETRIEKLYKDVPIKFTIELEQIIEGTPIIKALIIDFYSNVGYKRDGLSIVFKNLSVKWR